MLYATLILIKTDTEIVGIGEAWGPCSLVLAALETLKPYFIGRNIYDHGQIPPYIYSQRYHLGYQNTVTSCLSGIDIAAWDAIGKDKDLPVHSLIGGQHQDREAHRPRDAARRRRAALGRRVRARRRRRQRLRGGGGFAHRLGEPRKPAGALGAPHW